MEYDEFIKGKVKKDMSYGFDIDDSDIHPLLFDFQREVVKWAVKKGRCAIFQDCGLGKTIQQLEWARHIHQKTNGKILILTPLAVAQQTVREGKKIDLKVNVCKRQSDAVDGINVTNYEKLHHFDPKQFVGIVLDESSILKSFNGKTRIQIQKFSENIEFRLCCTATPSPNDYVELGNHCEFLGCMTGAEMLSNFFIHDDTLCWRLKGHAEYKFWEWMSNWCVAMQKPSDIGYEDNGFDLPELNVEHIVIKNSTDFEEIFDVKAETLTERRQARRDSMPERVERAAEIANNYDGPVLVWCDLNDESDALRKAIRNSVEVAGKHDTDYKEKAMNGFSNGDIRVLVSKPSIAGFGMNWQHCCRMVFVGLSDSYEMMYQAIRRCYRFGQKNNVHVTIITSDKESNVVNNVRRKEADHIKMFQSLVKCISKHGLQRNKTKTKELVSSETIILPKWMEK